MEGLQKTAACNDETVVPINDQEKEQRNHHKQLSIAEPDSPKVG
jgi:hypothetical protein